MSEVCSTLIKGIPRDCRIGNNYLAFKGFFLTTESFQFDTAADGGDETNWNAGTIAKTIWPVHNIKEVEDVSGDDMIYESSTQEKKQLFEGKRGFIASFDMTLDQHKVLRTYAGKSLRIFWYDMNNNIIGTSPDGVVIKGFKISFSNVQKLAIPTADSPSFSKLEIQLADSSEFDDSGHTIVPTEGVAADKWYPYNIEAVSTVVVTQVGTVTANVATFDVAYESSSDTGNDGDPITDSPISGLDVVTFTNFIFTEGGVVEAPASMTEVASIPGRYTATFAAFTSGNVQINPTATNPYESDSTALSA